MYSFKSGLKGVARSSTVAALDRVAQRLNVECFETPTGWKYPFDGCRQVLGLRRGVPVLALTHQRKDGPWASWRGCPSCQRNENVPEGGNLSASEITESLEDVRQKLLLQYDYEGCESDPCNKIVESLREKASKAKKGDKYGAYELDYADDFEYTDPIDGSVASKQGVRFVFTDGSRFIFRLSGTGSSGATVRMYIEQYEADEAKQGIDAQVALKPLIDIALEVSELKKFTGRESPTVIT